LPFTTNDHQVPQLFENYRQKSAQGISLTFLCVWFVGDVANLIGALWARLVPTVIALAIYFCIADTILIAQCVYYNTINAREDARLRQASTATVDEEEPLLGRRTSLNSESNIGLPGSRRRKSSAASKRVSGTEGQHLPKISEDPLDISGSAGKEWAKNLAAVFMICAVGASGWAIAWQTRVWLPVAEGNATGDGKPTPLGAEIVGYFSAICYLGARIPQIVKNARERSCDGLSLLFFLLSVLGNLTYGAGVSFGVLKVLCRIYANGTLHRFSSTRSRGTISLPTYLGLSDRLVPWSRMPSFSFNFMFMETSRPQKRLNSFLYRLEAYLVHW